MQDINDKLIVALDVDTLEKAERLVNTLYPTVRLFKVGSQLFTAHGPAAVEMIGKKGARVFLDLKFYDIPNTVYMATASGTSCAFVYVTESRGVKNFAIPPVFMMTVHIAGGKKMLEEASRSAKEISDELRIPKPLIVGVTRLTSEEYSSKNTQDEILGSARLAKDAGLDGVVCAVSEAKIIREEFDKNFIIVTPGIRPKGTSVDDQKRIATAQEAIEAGANYIVVGRPIIEAEDPRKATENILDDIKRAAALKEIVFYIFAPRAKEVYVAGDFNDWILNDNSRMRRDGGRWVAKINLKPGKYHYQFFIDGGWVEDPNNPVKELDQHGKMSSLIELKGK